jgi:hypothetical protein
MKSSHTSFMRGSMRLVCRIDDSVKMPTGLLSTFAKGIGFVKASNLPTWDQPPISASLRRQYPSLFGASGRDCSTTSDSQRTLRATLLNAV